jgi:drug/metabolite transporter (DMT)-like permease
MHYLILVSLLWAFSFGLIGSRLAGVDAFFVAAVRLSCATLVFLPWLRIHRVGGSDCLRLFSYGAIQFGLMYVCYMQAFQYIPSHLVALFSVMTPLYVVLIYELRQGRFSRRYLSAASLSVLGAATIKATTLDVADLWIGFGLMQLAGLAFAYGQVAYREWKRGHASIKDHEGFALLTLGGVFFAGIASLILTDWQQLEVSVVQWQSILYLGVVASGIGFFCWNKGAALSQPGTLAACNNAVVPIAVCCSLFVFGEIGDVPAESLIRLAIGTVLIASAVWVGQRKTSRSI